RLVIEIDRLHRHGDRARRLAVHAGRILRVPSVALAGKASAAILRWEVAMSSRRTPGKGGPRLAKKRKRRRLPGAACLPPGWRGITAGRFRRGGWPAPSRRPASAPPARSRRGLRP